MPSDDTHPTAPDASDILATYGAEALAWEGDPDDGQAHDPARGLDILAEVVDRIEGLDEGASKTERMAPIIGLYGDPDRWAAVVRDSITDGAMVDAMLLRLQVATSQRVADGMRSRLSADRREEVRRTLHLADPAADVPVTIAHAVRWPDYPPEIRVPAGWRVSRSGLSRLRTVRDQLVEEDVGRPILVTRTMRDADDGSWSDELAWTEGAGWTTAIVQRSTAMSARDLVSLADLGAPVSSASSRRLVEWLQVLDQDAAMPHQVCAARMGWVGSQDSSYMLGETQIRRADAETVTMAPTSPGARQVVQAVTTRGTLDGWLGIVDIISDQPAAWAIIYAACAAPLLRILRAPCFGIDLCGLSGRGKSTILELAASVAGDPRPGRMISSWGGTLAGTEGAVSIRCDMPLLLDEGQLVPEKRWSDAGALLYALMQGSGRSKGALGRLGLSLVPTWLTVLLSTSEVGITSWSQHDGVRRRVLELRGAGLRTAEDCDQIREIIADHHGHIYPRLIRHLVDATDMRPNLIAGYRQRRATLRDDAKERGISSPIVRSAAGYIAVIDTAAVLLHRIVGIPEPTCDPSAWLWRQVLDVTTEADLATRARDVALAWCWGHRDEFRGQADRTPARGWAGVWREADSSIAVRPELLAEEIRRAGLGSMAAILRTWADRGWIDHDPGRRTRKIWDPTSTITGAVRPRMICLRIDSDHAG